MASVVSAVAHRPFAFAILLLSLLSAVSTLVGVGLAFWLGNSVAGIATGIGFSAGIMLLISIVELMPEAVSQVGLPKAVLAFALGTAAVASLNWIVPHTHLVEEKGRIDPRLLKSAYLVAFGLILHDVPEGFAMANSYLASPSLGVLVALAIALHNVPEEFAMAAPAIALGKQRFLLTAALLSALAEPAGAVLGLIAVRLEPELNPLFMALAAGAMVFVSLHELFPMARRYGKRGLFGLGAGIGSVVYLLLTLAIRQ